jgi:hypothetical protein
MTEPHDLHRRAQFLLLSALRDGRSIDSAADAVAVTASRRFSPDIAMLDVGVAALDAAEIGEARRLAPGLASRYLPEVSLKNKRARQEHLAFALYATTARRGGLDLDLLDDTYWWGATDPMWRYALWAAVIFLRAGAEASSVAEAEFLDRVGGVLRLDV